MNNILNRLCSVAAVFACTVTTPTLAQQPMRGAPADRTNQERARQQNISNREWQLRNFGNEPKNTSDQKKVQALGEQIEQDFNRILILHNEFAKAISAQQQLDYQFIAAASNEIRKRASRLQTNLALSEPESQPEKSKTAVTLSPDQLRSELITLCTEIKNFVTNPVIETPGTINLEQLTKARKDLADIIVISDSIKKAAEKLDKATN